VPIPRAGMVTVLLAALLIVGCGGGSDDSANVKKTMTRLYSALASGDGATACSLATPSGRAKLERGVGKGASCVQIVALLGASLPAKIKEGLRSVQVKKVTIHGNTATVQEADVTSTSGSLSGFLRPGSPPTILTKQADGTWKVSE
jgi:hypothetical protein